MGFPGERGTAWMTMRGMMEMAATELAARADAKLALVIPRADPLGSPAWGFTLPIEHRYRLAGAMLRSPRAAVAGSQQPPAMRGT